MDQILIEWIGGADIDASLNQQHGSISAKLQSGQYRFAYLLYNYEDSCSASYIQWLQKEHRVHIQVNHISLKNPQHLDDICQVADPLFKSVIKQHANLVWS